MNENHAAQIASLLNARNQLARKYTADDVMKTAANYLYDLSDQGVVVACVELKKVQWYQFEISHLSVIEDKKGYGRTLYKRAEALAKALGCLVLQCTIRENNERSRSLFEKNDFKRGAEFYYPATGNNVGVWYKVLSPKRRETHE